jgi:aminopeptidase N
MSVKPVIYLKDYTAPNFQIDSIALRFDLEAESTRVTSLLKVRRHPDFPEATQLQLDGHESLELVGLRLNGQVPDSSLVRRQGEQLLLDPVPEVFDLEIETRLYPAENTALEGLYLSDDMYCTQCEAEGFRRITFYPDRPDVMSVFSTTLVADKARFPILLSNGNPVEQGDLDGGRHWVTWQDPFPKPAYLFALVAGDLSCLEDHFITASGRRVALQIYAERKDLEKLEHAMTALKNAMRWDEQVYGREYDLDIYMIVAVDFFNMGAMENKGLNIFNTACVLAHPRTTTDAGFQRVESVVAHEYFHNWSGNRVTCRDWFQLSLKEGFTVFRDQSFSADMHSAPVQRVDEVAILRTAQFAEDAGPMAHPVRPASFIEISNFYTLTVYEKGAAVVRMLHTLLGAETFRKGTDLYFDRHDGQAVTTDDFVKAMEDVSGRDLTQFKRWYSQAGTPKVTVDREYDAEGKRYTLTFTQEVPDTPGQANKKPMQIPVKMGLVGSDGAPHPLTLDGEAGEGPLERVLNFSSNMESFIFTGVEAEPVPSLFRGFSAPINKNVDYTEAELIFLMGNDPDPFNRWDAAQQLFADTILGMVADLKEEKPLSLSEPLVEAVKKTLTHDSLDKALIAQALTLPSETELGDRMGEIDVDGIHAAREFVANTLAEKLKESWQAVYEACRENGPYTLDPESMARRRLKSLCLTYLARVEAPSFVFGAFEGATNMTDELAAFTVLADLDAEEGEKATGLFYEKWKADTLVLDKWFTSQAVSSRPGTLERVTALAGHSAFDIKNPNKVRALIGAFCQANPWHFHRKDGKGYDLLADTVIALNTINPSIAARMASGFNRWKRYDKERQGLMKARLERIKATENLASGVFEIVSKALA